MARVIGTTILHYRLISGPEAGGVYKAEDTRDGRTVAMRLLPRDLAPDTRKRLTQEARAMSRLRHHNICAIHELNETENGQPFVCTDYCEGESLAARLTRGRMELDEAIRVIAQIADGLQYAHGAEIVHRSVSPDHIIIGPDGVAMLTGFEDAFFGPVGESSSIRSYSSPEQRRGEKLDHHTDIYSLGVVFSETLSDADPAGALIAPVLARMTAQNPCDRYRTVAEAIEALARAREGSLVGHFVAHKRRITFIFVAALIVLLAIMAWFSFRHRASITNAQRIELEERGA